MTERARHATVVLPQLGSFAAVVDMDCGHATAMLLARPLQRLAGTVGSPVAIDIVTHRGLLHIDAHVVDVPGAETLELDLTGRSELIQRRGYARVDALLDVVVRPVSSDAPIATAILNISASGAVISRLGGMKPGDEAKIALQLGAYEPPLEIVGRVVREFDDELRGMHFEQILEADRERIVRFVFERQRLELRHGRL